MTNSGIIHFKRGDGVARAITDLSYAPSLAAIETFCASVHPMTTAAIDRIAFTSAKSLTGYSAAGGEIYDLNYAAHFKFRRVNPSNDIRFRNFRLPGPKMDIFELIPNRGYRVKKAYGETLAAAFSLVSGETLEFDSGWMVH